MKKRLLLNAVMIFAVMSTAFGQGQDGWRIITGKVTDLKDAPVKGAIVIADRQNTGIITDKKGEYRIKISPAIKSVGIYSAKSGSVETTVNGENTYNFVLDGTFRIANFVPGDVPEEETVDIGYGTVRKSELDRGTGYIDATENRYSSYTNIYEMLKGQVPGVQVYGTKIYVRGISSVNSGTDPLFVVDGAVVNSIDNISPREVKSITVLKGSDAAIYGVRGANGVILINLVKAGDR